MASLIEPCLGSNGSRVRRYRCAPISLLVYQQYPIGEPLPGSGSSVLRVNMIYVESVIGTERTILRLCAALA